MSAAAPAPHMTGMITIDAYAHARWGRDLRTRKSDTPVFLGLETAIKACGEDTDVVQVLMSFPDDIRFGVELPIDGGTWRWLDSFDAAVETAHAHGLAAGPNVKALEPISGGGDTIFQPVPLSAFISQCTQIPKEFLALATSSDEQDTP